MLDSFVNFINSFGTSKDPISGSNYTYVAMSRAQLEAAFRSDWVARKTVEIPARDATREWRRWHADDTQIETIEEIETNLDIRRKVYQAMVRARLYGGAALVLGVDQGASNEEIDLDAVGEGDLKYVHVVAAHDLVVGEIEQDITSPYYCEPKFYRPATQYMNIIDIHPSRVIRFIGSELPDHNISSPAGQGWGDSILQVVDDAIKAAGLVAGGIAAMVNDAKLDVIRIPGLSKHLSSQDYTDKLKARFGAANTGKSILNALLLDKDEEWERIASDFGSLPDVLKMYLLIASGAADIPATRMLGQSAQGLNATGDGDIRNYYDRIASEQRTVLTPALARLDEVLIRSAIGAEDPDIYYEWAPLWQMDEAQKAEIANKKANTFKIDVDTAALPIEALAKARSNQLIEDGTYPGLESALEDFEFEKQLEESHNEPEPDPLLLAQATNAANAARAQGLPPPSVEAEEEPVADARPRKRKKKVEVHYYAPPRYPHIIDPRDVADTKIVDVRPRTLYVRRDVLNASEIITWAKAQGFATTIDDMHVTVAFSRQPVDWLKVGQDWNGINSSKDDELVIPSGGPRVIEQFGGGAVVLAFASTILSWRHEQIKRDAGASWDFPDYQPHITLTYSPGDIDLDAVTPYRGRIVLGPEIFEEVDPDYKSKIAEDAAGTFDPAKHPRAPAGSEIGGEFVSSGPAPISEPDAAWRAAKRAEIENGALISSTSKLAEEGDYHIVAASYTNVVGQQKNTLHRLRVTTYRGNSEGAQSSAIEKIRSKLIERGDQVRSVTHKQYVPAAHREDPSKGRAPKESLASQRIRRYLNKDDVPELSMTTYDGKLGFVVLDGGDLKDVRLEIGDDIVCQAKMTGRGAKRRARFVLPDGFDRDEHREYELIAAKGDQTIMLARGDLCWLGEDE